MSNPENMPITPSQIHRIQALERVVSEPATMPKKYYAAERRIGELERLIIARDRKSYA